jgi:hypothetical protein
MLDDNRHSRRRAAELRALRDRAYRRRRDACRICVRVELGADELELLLRTGWLLEGDAADAQEIGRAVSAMLSASSRS